MPRTLKIDEKQLRALIASGKTAKEILAELVIQKVQAAQRTPPFDVQISCEIERHGSDYGGWDICTGMLDSSSIVYSFGIGEDATFDLSLISRYGCTVYAFDPTKKSIDWVHANISEPKFILSVFGLAGFDGSISLYPPENENHVSHSIFKVSARKPVEAPVRSLATIMRQLGHDHIDIVKMDIEGAEYQVIDTIVAANIPIRQLLVEFHHRFPGVGMQMTVDAIRKLNGSGFKIFSISPSGMEYCFIRQ